MNLTEMRKIAEARTKGKWIFNDHNKNGEYSIDPICMKSFIANELPEINDAHFIALAANTYDELLDIAEAAYFVAEVGHRKGCMLDGVCRCGIGNIQEALKKLEELDQ